jgi:hypothetical protein
MATTTVQSILDKARLITDYTDSEFITDAEMIMRLNDHRNSLYLQIYSKCDPTYFWEQVDITITDGEGDLPSDFFQAKQVRGKTGDTYFNMQPRSHSEANDFDNSADFYNNVPSDAYYYFKPNQGKIVVSPDNSVTEVRMFYVPVPTQVSAVTDTINLIFHEDRYLVASLAVDIRTKDESDYTANMQEKLQVLGEIITSYKPDKSYPKKVVDYRNRNRISSRRRR